MKCVGFDAKTKWYFTLNVFIREFVGKRQNVQPELFAKYPEPIINDVLISPDIELVKQN